MTRTVDKHGAEATGEGIGQAGLEGMCQRSLKHEDRVATHRAMVGGEEVVLMLVADGHGGSDAAELCTDLLPAITSVADDGSAVALCSATCRAFESVHLEACAASNAGATLSVVIANCAREELSVLHVGDSAVLLVDHDSQTVLSSEHRLSDSEAERKRVQSVGGIKIGQAKSGLDGTPGGPLRAWPGGLAVCRTIGDADCPAASAVPDQRTVPFDVRAGAAVVVASDGVWDAISHEKVARIVRKSRTAVEAAEAIVNKAVKTRGLRDDTSCAVAWLGLPPWDESFFGDSAGGIASRLGRRISLAFGSRSPSSSSASTSLQGTPQGTPLSSPSPSTLDLAGMDPTNLVGHPPSALDLAAMAADWRIDYAGSTSPSAERRNGGSPLSRTPPPTTFSIRVPVAVGMGSDAAGGWQGDSRSASRGGALGA